MQINIVLLSFQHIFVGHFQRALQDIIKLKLGKLNFFERKSWNHYEEARESRLMFGLS